MTAAQERMCEGAMARMRLFYSDRENERRFQEWKSSRRDGGASQQAGAHRAPSRFTIEPYPC